MMFSFGDRGVGIEKELVAFSLEFFVLLHETLVVPLVELELLDDLREPDLSQNELPFCLGVLWLGDR